MTIVGLLARAGIWKSLRFRNVLGYFRDFKVLIFRLQCPKKTAHRITTQELVRIKTSYSPFSQ